MLHQRSIPCVPDGGAAKRKKWYLAAGIVPLLMVIAPGTVRADVTVFSFYETGLPGAATITGQLKGTLQADNNTFLITGLDYADINGTPVAGAFVSDAAHDFYACGLGGCPDAYETSLDGGIQNFGINFNNGTFVDLITGNSDGAIFDVACCRGQNGIGQNGIFTQQYYTGYGAINNRWSATEVAVPETSSVVLLSTMLLGVAFIARKRFARGNA